MGTKYVIGIDQGTTGTRAMAFDHDSNVLSSAYTEFTQYFPKPGWVEHDATEIYEKTMAMVKQCVEEGGLAWEDMAAIGITNQRETTVIWDKKTGEPVCPCIVWQDMRTADRCTQINENGTMAEEAYNRTGSQTVTNCAGPKIEWIMQNNPEIAKGLENGDLLFGWIDTWLIWKMSGGAAHITDYSCAGCTLLINLDTLDYDEIMLKEFGIPKHCMPKLIRTGSVVVDTDPGIFFGVKVPIGASAGDQNAATFGQACIKPGMIKNTYGTGSFIVMNVGKRPTTVPFEAGLFVETTNDMGDEVTFCIEGFANVSGSAIQWLRDGLGIVVDAKEAEELALSVEDNGGVYFVPSFAGDPTGNDPYARGTIIGLTRGSTKAHLCRAAIEAMAFQVAESFQAMAKYSGIEIQMVRADGGGAKNDFLLQFQADILGVPVERPVITETTCLGAAYCAGIATGFWKDQEEVSANWKCDKRFEPRITEEERQELLASWNRAVQRASGWLKK